MTPSTARAETSADASVSPAAPKPRLLVLSHVMPMPPTSGQQQRVFFSLQAARARFHVTFVGIATGTESDVAARRALAALCDDVILLPDAVAPAGFSRARQRASGAGYVLRTGLKKSNYVVGRVQFPPSRLSTLVRDGRFDCALFEYWHAVDSVPLFRQQGIACVLDMHDILWRSYERQLEEHTWPAAIKRWALERYRAKEERAWTAFDAVVAINREEQRYVQQKLSKTTPLFHAPMGTDLERWLYCWSPRQPDRLAYYGGLASPRNQQAALQCAERIMPLVWQTFPDTELWLVGSGPNARLRGLTADPRVKVTGFLKDPQEVLKTMTAVLCPWTGTFGFRSRLVEVMALGVPTIVTPDAVWGMDLERGRGLLVAQTDAELAACAVSLIGDPALATQHSFWAREQVEASFSLETTYDRMMTEIHDWVRLRRAEAR